MVPPPPRPPTPPPPPNEGTHRCLEDSRPFRGEEHPPTCRFRSIVKTDGLLCSLESTLRLILLVLVVPCSDEVLGLSVHVCSPAKCCCAGCQRGQETLLGMLLRCLQKNSQIETRAGILPACFFPKRGCSQCSLSDGSLGCVLTMRVYTTFVSTLIQSQDLRERERELLMVVKSFRLHLRRML